MARTGAATCARPVSMMERYFATGRLAYASHEWVCKGISETKSGDKLKKGGGLSYSRARELLLGKMAWTLHCLGCKQVVPQQQLMQVYQTCRLFKRHGGSQRDSKQWVSEGFGGQVSGGVQTPWPLVCFLCNSMLVVITPMCCVMNGVGVGGGGGRYDIRASNVPDTFKKLSLTLKIKGRVFKCSG